MYPKIDVHIHAGFSEPAEGAPEKKLGARDVLDGLACNGVVRAIVMSGGEAPGKGAVNRDCMEFCRNDPRLHWCCNFDDTSPETIWSRMLACKKAGAVGVGELMINRRLDSPILQEIFSCAEQLSMPITIHMSPKEGFEYGVVDDPGLPLLEKVLKEHPNLTIVGHSQTFWIEISGDAPVTPEERYGRGIGPVVPGGRLVELFRKYPNLYGDLSAGSGFCAITRDETFGLHFLTEFADRLMFGTDSVSPTTPWKNLLSDWMEAKVKEGALSQEVMQKICYQNAARLFGILSEEEEPCLVQTACGPVLGLTDEKEKRFLGIRYASAERWKYPEVIKQWDGIWDATQFGNCSYQPRAFHPEAQAENHFYYDEFRKDMQFRYSDDCLYLNVWTPKHADKLPVIVYIHGGAFAGGCGHEKHMSDPKWTAEGVVSVTINYRLGPFGFLCSAQTKEESGHTGNYGLYDQVAALQWIHTNIASFGGDPDNVTIMGQSAGAMSVQLLCITPEAEGLFHRAVMLSGGGDNPLRATQTMTQKDFGAAENLCHAAGCANLEELRQADAGTVLDAWFRLLEEGDPFKSAMWMGPRIDGFLLKKDVSDCMKDGSAAKVPYLLCSTKDDLNADKMRAALCRWAAAQLERGIQDTYTAYFCRNLPGDDLGSWHSADLWYWFGTLDRCWRPMTAWDRQLSAEMVRYITNFAATGNPNGESLCYWPCAGRTGEKSLILGDHGIWVDYVRAEQSTDAEKAVHGSVESLPG